MESRCLHGSFSVGAGQDEWQGEHMARKLTFAYQSRERRPQATVQVCTREIAHIEVKPPSDDLLAV
jgi:hypothetical protein